MDIHYIELTCRFEFFLKNFIPESQPSLVGG
jgi:hypothetical protein